MQLLFYESVCVCVCLCECTNIKVVLRVQIILKKEKKEIKRQTKKQPTLLYVIGDVNNLFLFRRKSNNFLNLHHYLQ